MDENQSSDPRKQDQLPDSKPETSPVCSSVESPVQTIRKAAFLSKNDPNSGCKSFSQLLAGQMASPANSPAAVAFSGGPELKPTAVLTLPVDQSTYMVVPQGLITSTGIFPSGQGQFGISHQQVLANVTAQAVQAQAQKQLQAGYSPNQLEVTPSPVTSSTMSALNITPLRQLPPAVSEDSNTKSENGQLTCIESKPQLALVAVEKPSNDVYNWRKYGQKQVKGSDYPRSYYKCTHSTCTVKKMVVRSLEGHPTEIIYKGEHNHEPPPTRRVIGFSFVASGDGNESLGVKIDMAAGGNPNESDGNPIESDLFASQSEQGADPATGEHVSVSDEIEEDGKALVRVDEEHGDEPDPKRRNTDNKIVESAPPHRTAREPRIVVQTTSEVEVLYDGYRWRKYGQKIVKGNPNPRSYYKCTSMGCPVRKHVERSSSDAKSVITTYEGKHNHDIPQTKNSNHESSTVSTAVTTVRHIKAFNVVSDQNPSTIESPGTENRDGGERPQVNNPANGEHIHDRGTELDGPKNPDETQSEGEKPNADCPSGSENDHDQRMGSNSKPCKPDGESKNPNAIQDAGEKADNPTNSKHIHDQGMVLDSNSSKLDSESKNQNQIQRPLLDENHVPVSVSILNT